MEFSARYKKAFREGYNNPSQVNIDLNTVATITDPKALDFVNGRISGYLKRKKMGSEAGFIWNEADLDNLIE